MISGAVSAELEAIVELRVGRTSASMVPITAAVDTGFDGWLTVPTALASSLNLSRVGRHAGILADGREVLLDIWEAILIWNGLPRAVPAAITDGAPLLGMSLLEGYELRIHVTAGGGVENTPAPPSQFTDAEADAIYDRIRRNQGLDT